MNKSEKAQASLIAIGMLLFAFAVGRTVSVNQDTIIEPTPVVSSSTNPTESPKLPETIKSPKPGLTLPSGGEIEDDEDNQIDDENEGEDD